MEANQVFIIFNSLMLVIMGYFLGEMKGYSQGIKSAARIWSDSLEQVTKAFISVLPTKKSDEENTNV